MSKEDDDRKMQEITERAQLDQRIRNDERMDYDREQELRRLHDERWGKK